MSPNWRKASAEQIFNHLNDRENESGRGTMDGNIADGVKRAEDKVKDVERREPKGKGRSDAALDKWEKELSEARAQLEKWREVERMRREQKAADGDDSDPTWKQAYDEFNSSDEEPVNLEDYVARHLYGTKFKWKDKEFERTGGRTHGLGGHLGLSKSDKERRGFFGWIDEKNGSYPESVAEGLYANMPDWMRERYDTMEVLDAILSVVGSNPRPRDMVVDYVKRLRAAGRGQDEEAERIAGERGYANAAEMEAGENQREREMASFHDVAAAGREADGARADLLADAQARLNDPNASEFEKQAARTVLRFRQRDGRDGVTAQGTEGEGVRFRVVRDPREVERLERGKKVRRYRAMQLIDGKLYPPMSAKVNGQLREPTELGVWEQADENPELARNGKFRLDKGQRGQGTVDAAYNPYFHTSTSAMNDQFSSAWKRPELVVVEVEIPESELTSGYRAEGAKDAVGDTDWKSGSVTNALPADRKRTVTLSRWMKAVRIVPDAEVADMIARQLEGTDIAVPFNVVNESLRSELVKRGVRIGEPEGSNAGRASRAAYEQWKNGTTVSERSDDIAERDVANVVVETGRDKLPTNRKEAKRMLDQMSQPFHNNDQGVDIYVSHGDATHMMNFRNDDQIKVVGVIDRVIANAVKIGEVPVHEDEATTTKAVHIYYCPINIDGKQYSGRMVVKEYFQGNHVVDELHLYNTQLRKETSNAQSHSPEGIPAHPSEVKNRYKVKDLIHSTQEDDRKLLGIGSNSPTLFRVRRAPNGEESRLDERQYDEVRTDNFKKWFGDWENDPENASKVVDANGEPLVVWHGTDNDFFTFDRGRLGENTDFNADEIVGQSAHIGFWFNRGGEEMLDMTYGKRMPVYLDIKERLSSLA